MNVIGAEVERESTVAVERSEVHRLRGIERGRNGDAIRKVVARILGVDFPIPTERPLRHQLDVGLRYDTPLDTHLAQCVETPQFVVPLHEGCQRCGHRYRVQCGVESGESTHDGTMLVAAGTRRGRSDDVLGLQKRCTTGHTRGLQRRIRRTQRPLDRGTARKLLTQQWFWRRRCAEYHRHAVMSADARDAISGANV